MKRYAMTGALILQAVGTLCFAQSDRLAGLSQAVANVCGAPQVGIFGDTTAIQASGFVYYRVGRGPWTKSPMPHRGHSLIRLPNGHWSQTYDEGKIVEVDGLSGKGNTVSRSELAGVKIVRPHDQIVDPKTGFVYVIDGNRDLFRFKKLEGASAVWTFTPEQMGYARSLSWFDGHIHVIDTSRGEVMRIDDYEKHRFTTFRSPRPDRINTHPFLNYGERDFMGGTLSDTGLILNDVEKTGGWYYGTNEFSDYFSMGGDSHPGRLIRWRRWADFEAGKWEDLSSYLPPAEHPFMPYYISLDKGILYSPISSMKANDDACLDSRILQLDLSTLPK